MRVDAGVVESGRQLGCRSPGRIGAGSLGLGGTGRHRRFLWKDHNDHKGGETSWEDDNVFLGGHCLECAWKDRVSQDSEGIGRRLEGSQTEHSSLE